MEKIGRSGVLVDKEGRLGSSASSGTTGSNESSVPDSPMPLGRFKVHSDLNRVLVGTVARVSGFGSLYQAARNHPWGSLMYNPRWFKEERREILYDAIEKIAFGTLVTVGQNGVLASHIPMLLDRSSEDYGRILGHIARGNAQWRDTDRESEGLAMFLGPDAYISPAWYQTGGVGGKSVPTWDYIAVHARGPIAFFEDRDRLMGIVERLTERHEELSSTGWRVDYPPMAYMEAELRSIVGFEMKVQKLEGKWKMGQNRSGADRKGAVEGLRRRSQGGDAEVAAEIEGTLGEDDAKGVS